MALMSYLIRDAAGTYYFRRVIPAALRPFMPAPWTAKTAWKLSLGTKDHTKAKRAAPRFLSDCAADFELAERAARGDRPIAALVLSHPTMPPPEAIEADELARLLAADDEERAHGDARRQLQSAADRVAWPDLLPVAATDLGMAEDHHHVYGEALGSGLIV